MNFFSSNFFIGMAIVFVLLQVSGFFFYRVSQRFDKILSRTHSRHSCFEFFFTSFITGFIPIFNVITCLGFWVSSVSQWKEIQKMKKNPSYRAYVQIRTLNKLFSNQDQTRPFHFRGYEEFNFLRYATKRFLKEHSLRTHFYEKNEITLFFEQHAEQINGFFPVIIDAYGLSADSTTELVKSFFAKNVDFFEELRYIQQNDPNLSVLFSNKEKIKMDEFEKKESLSKRLDQFSSIKKA